MGSTWVRGFWFRWFYVVNWGFVVWVQGVRREGFGDARFFAKAGDLGRVWMIVWVVVYIS